MRIPSLPPKLLLEQIAIQVNNSDVVRETVPLEAALSYPVPGQQPGQVCYFHYWEQRLGEPAVTRPMSQITAAVQGAAAEIVDIRFVQPDAPLFPDIPDPGQTPPAALPYAERQALEKVIFAACEQFLWAEARPETGHNYVDALHRLVWPGLLPFYRALNPDFAARVGL
jgi:hypothetical protein